MLTTAFIAILSGVVSVIAFVLPSGSFLPANFSDLLSDVILYAYGWDWIVPVGTIFNVFSAIIVFFVAELTWRSGKYLIALLRGN